MTRDKNSQKAEKKPLSTSEPVTQPQLVISAQSEYPQKARTASAQQPAQKIGSESSAQKSARGTKNTAAPAGSQKTTAVRTVEDVAKPQNQGVFRAVTALYGALVMLYAGWQIFSGARAVPENDALAANASLESNYAFFAAIYFGLGLSFLVIAVKFKWVNMLAISCLVVFLGGVGRIMSWATHGTPHWSLIVLMVTELVIPPCLLIWYAWINKSNKIRQDMLQASQQGKSSR